MHEREPDALLQPGSMIRVWGRSGRNLLVSSGGEAAVRLLTLATLVLIARYLDPDRFGEYSIFLAYYAIAAAVSNLGLDRLILREVAIDNTSPGRFGTLLRLRVGAGALTAVILLIIGTVAEPESRLLILLLSLTMLPAAPAAAYAAGFQARQNFAPPALAATLGGVTSLGIAGVGILLDADLTFFLFGFFASELVRAAWLVLAGRREHWATSDGFDLTWGRYAIFAAFPYGVLALLGMIYFRIDLVMLDVIVGGAAVGYYAAAFRVLDAGAGIPALIMGVLFPRFAVLQHTDSAVARELYLSATRLMLALGVILAGAGILFAGPIINIMFTDAYSGAVSTLIWLMLALGVLFWHAPNATVLFSRFSLRTAVYWSFVTMGFNVLANWILIPRNGAAGAAAATVMSEVLSLVIFTPLVCRYLGISWRQYLSRLVSLRPTKAELNLLLDRDVASTGSV